jgi:hypothetical protein
MSGSIRRCDRCYSQRRAFDRPASRDHLRNDRSNGLPVAYERRPQGRTAWRKAGNMVIGTARLFDYVEKYQGGLPARLKVENRLREVWPIWSEPQEL